MRKESPNLEFESITKTGKESPQEFVLAEGIKSLAVEYTYIVPEKKPADQSKEEAAKKEAAKEPQKKEFKKTTEWIRKEPQETLREPQGERVGGQDVAQFPLVPQLAEIKVAFWDTQKKRSTPFIFKIRIPSDIQEKREDENISQKLLGTLREIL